MAFFSFDFILQATFSRDFGFLAEGKDIDGMLAMLDIQFAYISTMGNMPWLDNFLLKNPLLLFLLRIPNPLVDFASARAKARLNGDEKADPSQPDFLTRFAQAQHPDVVTELQLITYATTNVLAASDTTSAALTAIIYHILKHPAVHAKLQAEIDASCTTFPVSYTDAHTHLPYLHATIQEVLRVFPTSGHRDGAQSRARGHGAPHGAEGRGRHRHRHQCVARAPRQGRFRRRRRQVRAGALAAAAGRVGGGLPGAAQG